MEVKVALVYWADCCSCVVHISAFFFSQKCICCSLPPSSESKFEFFYDLCFVVCGILGNSPRKTPESSGLGLTLRSHDLELKSPLLSSLLCSRYKSTVNGQQVIWQLTGNTLEKFVNSKSESVDPVPLFEELAQCSLAATLLQADPGGYRTGGGAGLQQITGAVQDVHSG